MNKQNLASFEFDSRRSDVFSTNGMVSTSQPLATQAALDILKLGGNAADAAVAAASCLNVTEPCSTGIGGDAFCLFYSAKDKSVRALNGSGRSPGALTLEVVKKSVGEDCKEIPPNSPHAITVPGACAAMVDTVEKFGSGKLSLDGIFSRAIQLAEEGYPVSEFTATQWKKGEEGLINNSPNGHELLVDGRAPEVGEVIHLPNLAKTYRKVAKEGKAGFYQGAIAEAIVTLLSNEGGTMALEDLKEHFTEEVEPISYLYQDKVKVFECPPNGQGVTALIALGLLDTLQEAKVIPNLAEMDSRSPEYLHILIETLRIAFADTRWHVTDPNFYNISADFFLNRNYLQERSKLFNPNQADMNVREGSPLNTSNTVHLSVIDKEGNACSFIMSNYAGFGSAKVPAGWGFTLQNRGSNFSLNPQHPNRLQPKKRPYHTIIPSLVLTPNDELWLCYGVMGQFMQPQGHVQVLMNMLHFKMQPQKSLNQPRFCIGPDDGVVYIEPGFPQATIEGLERMGHKIQLLSGASRMFFGRGQIVAKTSSRGKVVLTGGADPRSDGQAAGY